MSSESIPPSNPKTLHQKHQRKYLTGWRGMTSDFLQVQRWHRATRSALQVKKRKQSLRAKIYWVNRLEVTIRTTNWQGNIRQIWDAYQTQMKVTRADSITELTLNWTSKTETHTYRTQTLSPAEFQWLKNSTCLLIDGRLLHATRCRLSGATLHVCPPPC